MSSGRLPVADAGQAEWRQDHPCGPALHPHHRDGRIHAPVRAGTDIAFLGGLINYVLNNEGWNSDPFFKEYVVNYTNAATIISEAFKDAEELDGVFSGLMEYTPSGDAWPYDGFVGRYDNASWRYQLGGPPPEPRAERSNHPVANSRLSNARRGRPLMT